MNILIVKNFLRRKSTKGDRISPSLNRVISLLIQNTREDCLLVVTLSSTSLSTELVLVHNAFVYGYFPTSVIKCESSSSFWNVSGYKVQGITYDSRFCTMICYILGSNVGNL